MTKPTLGDKLLKALVSKDRVLRLCEQHSIPVSGYGSGEPDRDAPQYRNYGAYNLRNSQTLPGIDRKLLDTELERLQRLCVWMYQTNPLCQNGVDLMVNYCIGTGITVASPDENLQEEIDRFWTDPDNAWELKQRDRLRDLILFGEQFYPVFIADQTGLVRLGNIDPFLVAGVSVSPDNINTPDSVVLKTSVGSQELKRLKVIRPGIAEGEIFYFALNKLQSSSRGFSPLLSVLDWFDVYDRFLFLRAENRAKADEFLYHAVCDGMDQAQIKEFIDTMLPKGSGAGAIIGTNKQVELKPLSHSLNASDAKEEHSMIMGMICGGLGEPIHWLTGIGETINRASALSMGDPTMVKLQALQFNFCSIIRQTVLFNLHTVRRASSSRLAKISDKDLQNFQVIAPTINIEDVAEIATTLSQVTSSCSLAEDKGWIDKQTAAETFCWAASRLGKEVTPADDIDQKPVTKELTAAYKRNYGY